MRPRSVAAEEHALQDVVEYLAALNRGHWQYVVGGFPWSQVAGFFRPGSQACLVRG
jgi:hypothetical protein